MIGATSVSASPAVHLLRAVCRGRDRRGPSRAVSYSPRAPQAAHCGFVAAGDEMPAANRKQGPVYPPRVARVLVLNA